MAERLDDRIANCIIDCSKSFFVKLLADVFFVSFSAIIILHFGLVDFGLGYHVDWIFVGYGLFVLGHALIWCFTEKFADKLQLKIQLLKILLKFFVNILSWFLIFLIFSLLSQSNQLDEFMRFFGAIFLMSIFTIPLSNIATEIVKRKGFGWILGLQAFLCLVPFINMFMLGIPVYFLTFIIFAIASKIWKKA